MRAIPARSKEHRGIVFCVGGTLDGWAGSGTSAEMFRSWAMLLGVMPRRWPVLPLVFGVILLGVGYQTRMQAVDRMLPYCVHIDEHVWTEQSIRMLKTGDLNPHRFTKPSVMAYLNTAGFALGLLREGMSGDLPAVEELHGGFPYYSSPRMIRTVRQIYVLLSLASLVLCALVARHLVGGNDDRREEGPYGVTLGNAVALLTLGLGLLSPLYLTQSVRYLNVDLVGCFVNVCAMSYFVMHPRTTKPHVFGVLAGVAVGFCLGTKYNYYPMLAPALLVLVARYRAHWLSTLLLLLVSTLVTFVITTPYALLDLPAFAWSAAGEALHYAVGHQPGKAPHASQVVGPGVRMFSAYGSTILKNYGLGLAILAVLGFWRAWRLNAFSTAVFVLFPGLLWLYMSKQRAFFDRNLLILQLVLPVFASIGIVFVGQKLVVWAKDRLRLEGRWLAVAPALVLALSLSTFPFAAHSKAFESLDDSRKQVVAWLEEHAPAGRTILVAEELEMDPRTFPLGLKVKSYAARETEVSALQARHKGALVLVPVFSGVKSQDSRPALRKFGKNNVTKKKAGQWGARSHVLKGNPRFFVIEL
jgi:hypothetical protein